MRKKAQCRALVKSGKHQCPRSAVSPSRFCTIHDPNYLSARLKAEAAFSGMVSKARYARLLNLVTDISKGKVPCPEAACRELLS